MCEPGEASVLDIRRQLAAIGGQLGHDLLVQPDIHARGIAAVAGIAELKSTIEVRHSSFSPLAFTAWSRMGATSTVAAAGAAAPPDDPAPAAAPPPAGAASALLPKIALMIFPKMLIVRSQ
jgi:hypothetical protein